MKKIFTILSAALIFLSAFVIHQREPWGAPAFFPHPLMQTTGTQSNTDVGADITTGVQLQMAGGSNQNGKRTLLQGTSINFGAVSFINPEFTTNGDAYLENNHLMLETIIDIGVVFNGATSVSMQLNKQRASINPFYKTYYSLSVNRTSTKTETAEDPLWSPLTTITEPATVSLRMVYEILPQQKGRLTDRFKLEATSL